MFESAAPRPVSATPLAFNSWPRRIPAPCGYLGDKEHRCTCSRDQLDKYRAKLSGPLLDRIDLFCRVERLKPDDLLNEKHSGESSEVVATRVHDAQTLAITRQGRLNASAEGEMLAIPAHCDPLAKQVLTQAANTMRLSGRAIHRALRVARTIADLAGQTTIERSHMLEAISYRQLTLNNR